MNNEPISFDDWLAIADFYYHDKPPVRTRDARVIYLDKEEPQKSSSAEHQEVVRQDTEKIDNSHYNKPIMKLF